MEPEASVKRGPRRPKHEVLKDLELRVMRGKNEAILVALKKLRLAHRAFDDVLLAARGDARAVEAIEDANIGVPISKLCATLEGLLPEELRPRAEDIS